MPAAGTDPVIRTVTLVEAPGLSVTLVELKVMLDRLSASRRVTPRVSVTGDLLLLVSVSVRVGNMAPITPNDKVAGVTSTLV